MLEIPTGPSVRGRQLWRRTGNFLLIFLWFYVYDLRFKTWGPTTFLTEFPTLKIGVLLWKIIIWLSHNFLHAGSCREMCKFMTLLYMYNHLEIKIRAKWILDILNKISVMSSLMNWLPDLKCSGVSPSNQDIQEMYMVVTGLWHKQSYARLPKRPSFTVITTACSYNGGVIWYEVLSLML